MKKIIDDQDSLVLGPSSFSYPSALLSSSPFYAHLECVRVYSSLSLCKCVIKVSLVFLFCGWIWQNQSLFFFFFFSIHTHIHRTHFHTQTLIFSFLCLFFSSLQSQSVTVERCYRTGGWRWVEMEEFVEYTEWWWLPTAFALDMVFLPLPTLD